MRRLLADGDSGGARRLAHNLKGAAGTLGLNEIARQAESLERQIRNAGSETALESPLIAVQAAYDALAAALAGYLPQDDLAGEVAPLDVNELIKDIVHLLAEGNVRAAGLVREQKASLSGVLGTDLVERIQHSVDGFDYEAALALLDQWRSSKRDN